MIFINGLSAGFHEPTLRRVTTERKIQDKNLLLKDYKESAGYDKILVNHSNSESFVFQSKSASLTDGDLILINPGSHAIKLYDSLSTKNSLFLTEKCNCRCLSCPQPPKEHSSYPWAEIALQSIELIDPHPDCLGITGGEPTVKWSKLIEVLEKCSQFLPNTSIQLLSNGLVFKDYAKVNEMRQANNKLFIGIPLFSDIDDIHDELVGKEGAFWDVVAGLHNLERGKISVELRVVVSKVNLNRLPQLSEFIYKNFPFVSHVSFMALEPIGKAKQNIDVLWVDPVECQEKLTEAVSHLWRRGITSMLFNFPRCLIAKSLQPISVKAISDWKIRYSDECNQCCEKPECGGFFFSATPYISGKLRAIRL
jgi:His-Xaa-Ser system radical SAM maturase HxsC